MLTLFLISFNIKLSDDDGGKKMKVAILTQKIINNVDEVNEKGTFDVARYDYKQVAIKVIEDKKLSDRMIAEDFFCESQNIEVRNWAVVSKYFDFAEPSRSTKVGDYITIENRVYIVEPFGFSEVKKVGDIPEGAEPYFYY